MYDPPLIREERLTHLRKVGGWHAFSLTHCTGVLLHDIDGMLKVNNLVLVGSLISAGGLVALSAFLLSLTRAQRQRAESRVEQKRAHGRTRR